MKADFKFGIQSNPLNHQLSFLLAHPLVASSVKFPRAIILPRITKFSITLLQSSFYLAISRLLNLSTFKTILQLFQPI